MFLTVQASSDLSILDFDIPYTMSFVISGTIEVAGTIIIMIMVTWQVVLVVVPVVIVLLYIQVNTISELNSLLWHGEANENNDNVAEILHCIGEGASKDQRNYKGACHELRGRVDAGSDHHKGLCSYKEVYSEKSSAHRHRCDTVLLHQCSTRVGAFACRSTANLGHHHIVHSSCLTTGGSCCSR